PFNRTINLEVEQGIVQADIDRASLFPPDGLVIIVTGPKPASQFTSCNRVAGVAYARSKPSQILKRWNALITRHTISSPDFEVIYRGSAFHTPFSRYSPCCTCSREHPMPVFRTKVGGTITTQRCRDEVFAFVGVVCAAKDRIKGVGTTATSSRVGSSGIDVVVV